jgi:hypothetical protein
MPRIDTSEEGARRMEEVVMAAAYAAKIAMVGVIEDRFGDADERLAALSLTVETVYQDALSSMIKMAERHAGQKVNLARDHSGAIVDLFDENIPPLIARLRKLVPPKGEAQ